MAKHSMLLTLASVNHKLPSTLMRKVYILYKSRAGDQWSPFIAELINRGINII
jgi:hypothetical protein